MATSEQDWPGRSVWADMVSGPDDADEPDGGETAFAGPFPPDTSPPADRAAQAGALVSWQTDEAGAREGWTASGAAAAPYGYVPAADEPYGDAAAPSDAGPHGSGEGHGMVAPGVLLPGRPAAFPSGWRRAVDRAGRRLVRAREPRTGPRRMDLVLRARTPVVTGHHRVAVLSLKGGVGKTTTTVGLGSTLASLRDDRVIAVDASPDRGTLCDKLRLETAATVRDLLNEEGQVRHYADVRGYTTRTPDGLEVLAADRDPTISVAFSGGDYENLARLLEHYYSVCVTDCGTGLLHSAIAGVLRLADQIMVVSSASVDGARSASAALDWLSVHQYGYLAREAVVVLSAVRRRSKSTVDLGRLERHFAARCRAVVRIPYDAHLQEGAEVVLSRLSRPAADAFLALAAEVGDGFAGPRRSRPAPPGPGAVP